MLVLLATVLVKAQDTPNLNYHKHFEFYKKNKLQSLYLFRHI